MNDETEFFHTCHPSSFGIECIGPRRTLSLSFQAQVLVSKWVPMVLTLLRALFVLLMAAAGWYLLANSMAFRGYTWLSLTITLSLGVFIVCATSCRRGKSCSYSLARFWGCSSVC